MIEVRQENAAAEGAATVIECGEFSHAEGLVRCVDLAVRMGQTRIVVDFGTRDGADAQLLSVLHRSGRCLREVGGRLAVVAGSPRFRRLLDLTLLSHGFCVYATREEALAG